MAHGNMHNNVRRAAQQDVPSVLPSIITQADGQSRSATRTDLTMAPSRTVPALTVVVSTVEFGITQPASTFTRTQLQTISITDPAQFSSLRASESSAQAQTGTSQSSAAKTATAAQNNNSSNNLSTLIPAIVVPIAAVLITTFIAFWMIMRRRHKKQVEEQPNFVMASKPEKPISRGNSNSSGHSSTRELVPMSKLEKEMVVTTTADVQRSSLDMFPPKYTSADIGVARPMTPPDKNKSMDRKQFANFSSVRPGTTSRAGDGNRSRSHSQAIAREMPDSRAASRNGPSRPSRGPSPTRAGQMLRGRESPMHAHSPQRGALGPIKTQMNNTNRAPPPQALTSTTPTGAFNGASPISQYSPIVKDTPDLGSVTLTGGAESSIPQSALPPTHIPLARSVDSPTNENVLSRENMRIARLANSSRLGMNDSPEPGSRSLTSKAIKTMGGPATSPRMPAPLTRDDRPPKPFARGPDSPAGASSNYPSPSIGAGATPQLPQLGSGQSSTSLSYNAQAGGIAPFNAVDHRVSMVSGISSDDGYVDMELDAKSDVSSLDEREIWQTETDRRGINHSDPAHTATGYGSVASPAPPSAPTSSSAGTGSSNPNLRDRDSEGPFVLSRY